MELFKLCFFHTYFLKVYKNLLIDISIPIIKIKMHARVKIIIAICHKWIFTCYLSIWNIQRNGTGPTRIASRGRWTTKYTITSRNAGENIFPSLHIIIAMSFFICFNIFSFNILQYNSLKNKLSSINALQTSFCKYLHIADCSNHYKKEWQSWLFMLCILQSLMFTHNEMFDVMPSRNLVTSTIHISSFFHLQTMYSKHVGPHLSPFKIRCNSFIIPISFKSMQALLLSFAFPWYSSLNLIY